VGRIAKDVPIYMVHWAALGKKKKKLIVAGAKKEKGKKVITKWFKMPVDKSG